MLGTQEQDEGLAAAKENARQPRERRPTEKEAQRRKEINSFLLLPLIRF